jgi:thiol-disulfide isomerase/thioredoxin
MEQTHVRPTIMWQIDVASARRLATSLTLCVWLMVVIAGASLWSLAASDAAANEPAAGAAALTALEGSVKPLFVLPSLDGTSHDLARHGGRVVLVHFFATWCEPCRPEMTSLRELQSRLRGRPFTIVAVSVAEADGAVRRFFASDPSPFSVLLDRDRAIAKAWSIDTLPTTVVLDHALAPRLFAAGDVDWARPDVMSVLADLLQKVPAAPRVGGE